MKNIHLISTDKPSRLLLSKRGNLQFLKDNSCTNSNNHFIGTYQNIYITSDEEIKEGDKDFYIIANDRDKTWINCIEKVIECKIDSKHGKVLILSSGFIYIDEGCKIILTTDKDLIKDGVQAIDEEFLKWFIENPSCEEVKTDYIQELCLNCEWNYDSCPNAKECLKGNYKIIIPKEEPKKEYKPSSCDIIFETASLIDNKQEILEKAAFENSVDYKPFEDNLSPKQYYEQGFINGAKSDAARDYWFEIFLKQERMYSEEEVLDLLHKRFFDLKFKKDTRTNKEWFENFKKK